MRAEFREPGLLEQAGLVEQGRWIDREWNADLALAAHVVEETVLVGNWLMSWPDLSICGCKSSHWP